MTKNILVVAMFFLINSSASTNAQRLWTVIGLQAQLDSIYDGDKPIVLVEGSDFTAPPGTVIFLSRQAGAHKMVALARAGEPELCMLFLPEWGAWITVTEVRTKDKAEYRNRYIVAALGSGMEVEQWHSHNNLGRTLFSEKEILKRSIQWTMPSSDDLLRLYEFAHAIPDGRLKCIVASIYGTMTYWNDNPSWAIPEDVADAVWDEGYKLNYEASDVPLANLYKYAQAHKGFVKLKFDPVK